MSVHCSGIFSNVNTALESTNCEDILSCLHCNQTINRDMVKTKSQERRLEVNEMRMLRGMCAVAKKDKIRNEHVRGSVKVAPVTTKITEKRLKWYRHVKRRDEGHVIRRMLDAPVPGKMRGRQKTRWKDLQNKIWKVWG